MDLQITTKIIEIINSNIKETTLTLDQIDADLSALEMDSIAFIHIVVALEETFSIEVPDEYLLIAEMGTVNKMAKVVTAAIESTIK